MRLVVDQDRRGSTVRIFHLIFRSACTASFFHGEPSLLRKGPGAESTAFLGVPPSLPESAPHLTPRPSPHRCPDAIRNRQIAIETVSDKLPTEQQTVTANKMIGEASHLWEGDVGSFNALSFELVGDRPCRSRRLVPGL